MGVPDGAGRNFHTLKLMRQMIDQSKTDSRIVNAARSILQFSAAPERDDVAEVSALFGFVRDHIRYTRDIHGVETLTLPAITLQIKQGDCDDQTMLLCALCEAVGFPTRLLMGEFMSGDWEHVWCQILIDQEWIDCDPIERRASLGWRAPNLQRLFIEHVKL